MDDARGYFLGPPHGTTPAAVITNKTLRTFFSFGSSENVQREVVLASFYDNNRIKRTEK